jgi:hypothetical protein
LVFPKARAGCPGGFAIISRNLRRSQSDCYSIAKRIQKVVLSLIVLIAHPEALNLIQ